jgi:hypothetical protein
MDSSAVNDSLEGALPVPSSACPSAASPRTLSPASATAMNTLKLVTNTENKPTTSRNTVNPNRAQQDQSHTSDETTDLKATKNVDLSVMPHATSSRSAGSFFTPHTNQDSSPLSRSSPGPVSPTVRNISAEFGPLRSFSNFSIAEDGTASNASASPQQPWSSAVGKANLGKSGRVIEKLMADNDMLKREIQIAKLAAVQAKEDVKNAEGRMDALSSEYEARLHEAEITKALLKKRDRQVAEMKAQVDSERKRADAAVESERNWRLELDKIEAETKAKLNDAQNYVLMVDGRYDALQSHWKDQGAMLDATVGRMKKDTVALLEERLQDFKRMQLLQDLVDQKDVELLKMQDMNKAINLTFEAYKAEQASSLQDIKSRAQRGQEKSAALLDETQSVLGEMRWAIAVNRDLRDTERRYSAG